MADYLTEVSIAEKNTAFLRDRITRGYLREEAENMTRRELELAYIATVEKFTDLAEKFLGKLRAS